MDLRTQFVRCFERDKQYYDCLGEKLRKECDGMLKPHDNIKYFWECRTKTTESLERKLSFRAKTKFYTDDASIFVDIKDLVGARIILAWRSEDDLETIKKLITQTFDVLDTRQHPMSRSDPIGSTGRFPVYSALHFVVKSRDLKSSMSRTPELRFEIQVMSTFMYFYDSLNHKTYKELRSEAEKTSFDPNRHEHDTGNLSLWEPNDVESASLEKIYGLMRMSEMIIDKIDYLLVNTPNIRAMVDEEKLMLKKMFQMQKSWEDEFWGFTPRRWERHISSINI